jgi:hypothetical protein
VGDLQNRRLLAEPGGNAPSDFQTYFVVHLVLHMVVRLAGGLI